MSSARADVVALSNSEQQRETLVIMLDSDFDVTALPAPPVLRPVPPAAAVVVSAESWDDDTVALARRCWPAAGLVLVDAPAEAIARFPRAARATWADPLGLPDAVAAAAAAARDPRLADDDLFSAVSSAHLDLAPALETARVLAALLDVVRRPDSVDIAACLLGERMRGLCDRLAWVDGFAAGDQPPVLTDFGALLREVFENSARAGERDIEVHWALDEPLLLSCSEAGAVALALGLRRAVLDLVSGTVAITARAGELRCHHRALPGSGSFARAVAGALARRLGTRWHDDGSSLAVTLEEEDGEPIT